MKSKSQQYIEDNILDTKFLYHAEIALEMQKKEYDKKIKNHYITVNTLRNIEKIQKNQKVYK